MKQKQKMKIHASMHEYDYMEELLFNSAFADNEIIDFVRSLSLNKASADNLVPTHNCVGHKGISQYIIRLFSRLLSEEEIPEHWTISVVVLIHRKWHCISRCT